MYTVLVQCSYLYNGQHIHTPQPHKKAFFKSVNFKNLPNLTTNCGRLTRLDLY